MLPKHRCMFMHCCVVPTPLSEQVQKKGRKKKGKINHHPITSAQREFGYVRIYSSFLKSHLMLRGSFLCIHPDPGLYPNSLHGSQIVILFSLLSCSVTGIVGTCAASYTCLQCCCGGSLLLPGFLSMFPSRRSQSCWNKPGGAEELQAA